MTLAVKRHKTTCQRMSLFPGFHLHDHFHNCLAFDEGDHEDIVQNTTNLTNVDVTRKYQEFEERLPSAKLPTDIQVFFHCETVLSNLRKHRHDQDSSKPTSAPESSHTSLAQRARETRSEYSLEYDGILTLTSVVHAGVIHTTRSLLPD